MKKPLKAALLSGLVFPGIGHLYLGSRLRGFPLLAMALAALSVIFTIAYRNAQLVVGRILSGDVSMEFGAITQAISESTSAADNMVNSIAIVVVVACWLAGIFDSYRLGVAQEKQDPT